MQLSVSPLAFDAPLADALVVFVQDGAPLAGDLARLDVALGGALVRAMALPRFSAKAEAVEVIAPLPAGAVAPRLAIVGLGKELPATPEAFRRAVAAGVSAVCDKAETLAVLLPEGLPFAAEAAAEAAPLAAYTFHPYQKPDPEAKPLDRLVLLAADAEAAQPAAERGFGLASAVSMVRDLSNMPGNMLTPPALVAEARRVAQSHGLKATIIEGEELEKRGMGCLYGVGKGSIHAPALVVLEYAGGPEGEAPLAIVGKGLTFDTGGICIKPRAGMEEMKTDMHGAAVVLGTIRAIAERKLKTNVVAVMCVAENMPDGHALKPGDVITAYNGMTVEVIDTDAEGRLALSDGLSYVTKHHKPRAIVDLATLTGSIVMALGAEATGLFTNEQGVAWVAGLAAAGEATDERVWHLPTLDVYNRFVKSDIADLANASHEKGDAIGAAMFLKNFVGETPWLHLDIAGSSFISAAKPYRPLGSTGVGVRLLVEWVEKTGAKLT